MTDDTRVRELLRATATLMPTDLELARPALVLARRRRHARRLAYGAAAVATVAAVGAGTVAVWNTHGPAHSPTPHRTQAAAPVEHSSIPPVAQRATLVLSRGDGLHALDGSGQDHRFTVPGVEPGYAKFALSDDGTRLAVSDSVHGTALNIVDLPTGRITTYRQSGVVFWARWSPDGRKLLYEFLKPNPHSGNEPVSVTEVTSVLTLSTSQVREVNHDVEGMYYTFWTPDSARVLTRNRDGWVYLDMTGRVVQRLPQLAKYESGNGLSPDGRSFIVLRSPVSGEGDIQVVDLRTGAVLASPTADQLGGTGHGTVPNVLGWSGPDEIAIRGEKPARLLGYDLTTHKLRTVADLDGVQQVALPGT